jgi:GPH family glycoside/pentoside/hexuronide:cation symporter
MGKKKAFLLSQGISVAGYILLYLLFVPGKPYLFLFALPFFSFGIGSLFTLMMSMTSDVIDIDELNSGKRREGSLGAIYWWMVKFGTAVAGLLSGLILSLVSFKSNAPTQADETMFWLRIFFVGIPILGTLTAIWAMRDYDVDEAKALEVRDLLQKRKEPKKQTSSSSYLPGKLLSLSENTNTNLAPIGTNFQGKSAAEMSALFTETLQNGLHGLCFSPYSEGQAVGDILSQAQISKRMQIVAAHTKWIRSFSCIDGNEYIPVAARQKGLKTLVGAWISADLERNDMEIQALIALANAGLVDIAAVGNEVLHRKDLSEQQIIEYVQCVRAAVPSHVSVAYVDAYYQWLDKPQLVNACDIILANCYPFWEGADIDQAPAYLNRMYEITQAVANGKKVIITETGWPSRGDHVLAAVPSRSNASRYFIIVQEWAKSQNIDLFYFSSFDESWKIKQEGDVGAGWGIWDKNEQLKTN